MAKTDFKSVDEYIAAQPAPVQVVLERVRSAIRKALPKAEEVISYQIPAYTLNGVRVIFFASWKTHYSLYPAGPDLIAEFQSDLAPYEVVKSTIRFPLSKPVPARLIASIARFLAKRADKPEHTKRAASKKRSGSQRRGSKA